MAESYSRAQRIAFGCLVIGFLFCSIGAIVPYWQSGQIDAKDFARIFNVPLPFSITLVSFYGGLWWLCVEAPLTGEKECEAYSMDDTKAQDWILRLAVGVNFLLTLIAALVALSRSCCCGGGRTICHGIVAFIAGAAGFVVIGIFCSASDNGFIMKVMGVEKDWGFYMYTAGTACVMAVSFVLCFASPDNPLTPMIMSHMPTTSIISYNRMESSQVQMDPRVGQYPQYPVMGGGQYQPVSGTQYPPPGGPQQSYYPVEEPRVV